MFVALVSFHIKPEFVEAFKAATLDNARNSILEPGVIRFDVIQQHDDPTRFTLIEVFRAPEAREAHGQSAHYLRWREAVADMFAEPRTRTDYAPLFPEADAWEYPAVG
jgi:quinol monooxygenase YgiN